MQRDIMADFRTDVHARTRYNVHIKINGEYAAKKRWLRGAQPTHTKISGEYIGMKKVG